MKRVAILGSPIRGALSPVIHRAAYRAADLDWTYEAIECSPEQLGGFLAALDDTWGGLSLTMPLKRTALPLLDELTPLARAVGAVNTVIVKDGRKVGDNTDVHGMAEAIRESGVERPATAAILGAGATAATALAVLRTLGCSGASVVARDHSRAGPLLEAADRLGVSVDLKPWNEAPRHLEADLVISALPPGATDGLARCRFPAPKTLLDVLYQPWPTPLALAAAREGTQVIGGLPMLLHQAARQVVLQTGCREAPIEAMRAASAAVLGALSC
ncbi:shikimate dehydrogenase [Kitasatospora sp. NPDC001175]|uniref:shikimate dehydrogenase n=1 Tax=Kitasatospora sp. NPDC001175 TaxID=3157103 RepID=UPI003D05FE08